MSSSKKSPTRVNWKKMAESNYGYGWYTQEQLEDYYDHLIGRFFSIISILTDFFVALSTVYCR